MPYLTKSRFKEALECPDRMFYYGKRKEYADTRAEDDFLNELAKCGIQVGELAKCYLPSGIEVKTLKNDEAIKETTNLLQKESVTIFEAALSIDNLLVRVDILVKNGKSIEIIEVKSKSLFTEEDIFTKKGTVNSDWTEYVYDVAFQVYVARKIFKDFTIKGFLYVIDKSSHCTVDGLYQKFRLLKEGDRYKTQVDPNISIGEPILKKVELTPSIDAILNGSEFIDNKEYSFAQYVDFLGKAANDDKLIGVQTGRHCKQCPYKITPDSIATGLKSGFEHCWGEKNGFNDVDFKTPNVFGIWNLHHTRLEALLLAKRNFLKEVTKDDLQPKTKAKAESKRSLSNPERQWLQIERALKPELGPYVDKEALKNELKSLKFPIHCIDFEVAMNGIPYKKGLHPYHRLAFQYSHHIVSKEGKVSHVGQWLETEIGRDPNVEFSKKLKAELSNDDGSILVYSNYENSILLHLYDVISASNEPDKGQLLDFIKSITVSDDTRGTWIGTRSLVDMREWVLNSYLSPLMGNSNSIKLVLPAIISESSLLQKKYGASTYGTAEIPSLNFEKWQWLRKDANGRFINPYQLLPPLFDNLDRDAIETLFEDEELANGGAAMCAFSLMQFSDMTEQERSAIVSALYKYCELDTLAMVMVYEGLTDLANSN